MLTIPDFPRRRERRRLALVSALLALILTACLPSNAPGAPAVPPAPAGVTSSAGGAQAGRYAVLFDASHGETAGNADWAISTSQPDPLGERADPRAETDWTGALSAWGVALQKTGRYRLMTLPRAGRISYGDRTNQSDLANFDVFVVPEPNTRFTSAEKTAIMTFVRSGGGLFMIADHDQSDRNNDGIDSLHIWNDLMSDNTLQSGDPFGFRFEALNIGSDNPRGIPSGAAKSPVIRGPFGNVTGSIIRNGTTATINPASNPNVQALLYRSRADTSGTSGVFFLTSAFGKGRVAAWGDSSPIDDGTGVSNEKLFDGWDDAAGSNAILALNATEWLAQGGDAPATAPDQPVTALPAPLPDSGPPLIQNGDFERGQSGWRAQGPQGRQIVSGDRPHAGGQGAGLCGYDDCEESLAQTISIPSEARGISLSYYTSITTQETNHAFDFLTVELRQPDGKKLQIIQRLDDGSPAGAWQQTTFDLSRYAGRTVELIFTATCGKVRPTEFFIDDVIVTMQ